MRIAITGPGALDCLPTAHISAVLQADDFVMRMKKQRPTIYESWKNRSRPARL